jgi:hypothetical protein
MRMGGEMLISPIKDLHIRLRQHLAFLHDFNTRALKEG